MTFSTPGTDFGLFGGGQNSIPFGGGNLGLGSFGTNYNTGGGNNINQYLQALGALAGTGGQVGNIINSLGGNKRQLPGTFQLPEPDFDSLINSEQIKERADDIKEESKVDNIDVMRSVLNDIKYLQGITGAERGSERDKGFNQYISSAAPRYANMLFGFQPTGLNKGRTARDIGNIYNQFTGFNRNTYNEAVNPSSVKGDTDRLQGLAGAGFNSRLFGLSNYEDAASQALIGGKPLYSRATADFYNSQPVQDLINMASISNTGQTNAAAYTSNPAISALMNYGGAQNQFQKDVSDFYANNQAIQGFSDFRDPRSSLYNTNPGMSTPFSFSDENKRSGLLDSVSGFGSPLSFSDENKRSGLLDSVAAFATPLSFTEGRSDFYSQDFFQNPGSFDTKRSGYFGTGDVSQSNKLDDPFTFSSGRPDLDDSAVLADLGNPYTFSSGRSPVFESAGFDNPNTFASGRSSFISNDPDMRRPFRFSNSRQPYRG